MATHTQVWTKAKKGLFGPVVRRIAQNSGGNSSAPSCRGNTTNAGAKQLKNLTDTLLDCEVKIKEACDTNLPAPNKTELARCTKGMKEFKNLTDKCLKLTGTKACTCWESKEFTAASKIVKSCDSKKLNSHKQY